MGSRYPKVLIAALLALGMLAFAASASATKVTPAGEPIEATLKPKTTSDFIPENAYSNTSIRCEESSANATIPTQEEPETQNNTNQTEVGTNSTGDGSVIKDVEPAGEPAEPARFKECGFFVGPTEEAPAEVKTNQTNGIWTLAGDWRSEAIQEVAVGVPSNGARVFIPNEPEAVCTITVSNGRASAVMGRWTNGNNSEGNPSMMRIDAQIRFTEEGAGCAGNNTNNPAQFEAEYNVRTVPEGEVAVRIDQ